MEHKELKATATEILQEIGIIEGSNDPEFLAWARKQLRVQQPPDTFASPDSVVQFRPLAHLDSSVRGSQRHECMPGRSWQDSSLRITEMPGQNMEVLLKLPASAQIDGQQGFYELLLKHPNGGHKPLDWSNDSFPRATLSSPSFCELFWVNESDPTRRKLICSYALALPQSSRE